MDSFSAGREGGVVCWWCREDFSTRSDRVECQCGRHVHQDLCGGECQTCWRFFCWPCFCQHGRANCPTCDRAIQTDHWTSDCQRCWRRFHTHCGVTCSVRWLRFFCVECYRRHHCQPRGWYGGAWGDKQWVYYPTRSLWQRDVGDIGMPECWAGMS
jgi:hypothetical protein